MRVFHFSDFHLSKDSLAKDSIFTIEPFIKTIAELNKEQQIDLIIFSGDLIDKGGLSFETTEKAFFAFYDNVISKLCNLLNLGDEKFIISPGNHDIVRSLDPKLIENGCRATLITEPLVNEFIKEKRFGKDTSGINRIIPTRTF